MIPSAWMPALVKLKFLPTNGVIGGISYPVSFSRYSAISVITVGFMPSKPPRRDAYSNTIASSGTFPVRSPIPSREQLTAPAPYSHAVDALTTPL